MRKNPLKAVRLTAGLSQQSVADLTHLSRLMIVRVEQGFYPEPPSALIEFLSNCSGVRPHILREDYHEWQVDRRQLSYGLLMEPPPTPPLSPVGLVLKHPFKHWRELSPTSPNLTHVCKLFCLHQGLMYKFENSPHLVDSLPQPLVSALLESGYDPQTIKNLDRWYQMYLEHLKSIALGLDTGLSDRRVS